MANASVSKNKGGVSHGLLSGLFQVGLYKPSQGRVVRQVTFVTMLIVFALVAWRIYAASDASDLVRYVLSVAVLVVGGWFSYRVVNVPGLADFLIAVEAEMNKVSWPTRLELVRSSMVVIIVMFVLAMLLYGFDILWGVIFRFIGILQ